MASNQAGYIVITKSCVDGYSSERVYSIPGTMVMIEKWKAEQVHPIIEEEVSMPHSIILYFKTINTELSINNNSNNIIKK